MLHVLPTPTAEASLYRVSRFSYRAPSAGAFATEAPPAARRPNPCPSPEAPICCEPDPETGICIGRCCDKAEHCCPGGWAGLYSGNTCAHVLSDPANCGSCGNACPTGQRCSDGVCISTCPPGLTLCGNACVDTTRNPANCGTCGTNCADLPGGPYQMCCPGLDGSGQCMNSNDSNCGACGNACPPGRFCYGVECVCEGSGLLCTGGQCQNGICMCPSGLTYCSASDQCMDLSSNVNNCGSCGNVCASGVCCNGTCCPPGQSCSPLLGICIPPYPSCDFWTGLGCHWVIETAAPICGVNAIGGEDWCLCMYQTLEKWGVPACYGCVQSWFGC